MTWLAGLGLVAIVGAATSETIVVGDVRELQAAARNARPGTTILLKPGRYAGGLYAADLKGEPAAPIVLAGQDPNDPPVIEGGNGGIHLTDPVHVMLRDLVIRGARGNGLNIDDGGSFQTPAQHVVIERLTVEEIGESGNQDAIKLSGLEHFVVKQCVLKRWGGGGSGIDMVGCRHGEIVDCRLTHPTAAGGNGVQTKGGSSDIVIRRCWFENSGNRAINVGGSTGRQFFRPKIQGYEAKDILVEDCTFVGSGSPVAFVGVDGAVFRHNTIFKPQLWVLRILQETKDEDFVPSRNGRIERNLIVFESSLRSVVNIGSQTAPETFRFVENVWCCIDRPEETQRMVRLPSSEQDGRYGAAPQFKNADKGDFELQDGSPFQGYGVRPQAASP